MILLLLLSVSRVIITPADSIELNHVHNEFGTYLYSQTIIWEWAPEQRRHIPRAWRFTKNPPTRDGEFWTVRFGKETYRSKTFQETFTNYDRERRARRGINRLE